MKIDRHVSSLNSLAPPFILPVILLALWAVLTRCLPANAEEIKSFSSDITINQDCSLDVKEQIFIDFADVPRHGIFRNLPIQYVRYNNPYSIDFQLIDLSDQYGQPLKCTVSHQGKDVNLKIGDPDITMTHQHWFNITYHVRRAINFPDGNPELYWNVTGDDWPFKIDAVSATVHLPKTANDQIVNCTSYFGPAGSTVHGQFRREGNRILFMSPSLNAGDDLTIVVGLPKGSLSKPSTMQEAAWLLADWWPALTAPALTLLLMGMLWLQFGRDDDSDKPIAVEFNPPKDLTPAEVGTLIDLRCDIQDIVSTLIDLAARGQLKIRELETKELFFFSKKDYEFTRLIPANNPGGLKPHEITFLNGIFGSLKMVKLSHLRERFYIEIPKLKDQIYSALVSKGYLSGNPENVRASYLLIGIAISFCGFFFGAISTAWAAGVVISGLIIVCLSFSMPKRTAAGARANRECLGFKRFVQMAEKERIRVLADKDPTIFGRLLPFAMVLGCADQWAHNFQDLMTAPPDWYEPTGYGPNYVFTPNLFVDDLGRGMSTMQSTFVSAPPSANSSGGAGSGDSGSSSGFSGGGFGGGGGGSW